MLHYRPKTVFDVASCTCDRCGRLMTPDGGDFHERLSVSQSCGFDSVFGDGNTMSLDLCQQCVKETLGEWLRVTRPEGDTGDKTVTALKGIVGKPDVPVTIDEMNEAAHPNPAPTRSTSVGPMHARIAFDPQRSGFVATVEYIWTLVSDSPPQLGYWLYDAGVPSGNVRMQCEGESQVPENSQRVILERMRHEELRGERGAALRGVPVQRPESGPPYVRLADIPAPWQSQFRAALRGSACPVAEGARDCAYWSDWIDWIEGRFPRPN
ncbi:hypothetical protein [Paraburkholderia hospita]|uniref:hypothetical protein n=1 Tax=Paraburkholderia hospita TaxID=169430 RepID=UPI003ECFBA68